MSNLVVKLRISGDHDAYIPVPEGVDAEDYLERFIGHTDDFKGEWVQLSTGEYVRYDCIVSVRLGT